MKEQVHSYITSLFPGVLAGNVILQACKSVLTAWCQVGVTQVMRAMQLHCHLVVPLGNSLQACETVLTVAS